MRPKTAHGIAFGLLLLFSQAVWSRTPPGHAKHESTLVQFPHVDERVLLASPGANQVNLSVVSPFTVINGLYMVPPDKRLKLKAVSSSPPAWSSLNTSFDGLVGQQNLLSPLRSPYLVVAPFSAWLLEVSSSKPYIFGAQLLGGTVAQVRIYVNSPPAPGNVTVWPLTGVALTTTFRAVAAAWHDDHLPLSYAFLAQRNLTSPHSSQGSKVPLRGYPTPANTLTTVLPSGNPSVRVYVVVYDGLGASSTAAAPRAITVTNRDNVTAVYRSLKQDLEAGGEESPGSLLLRYAELATRSTRATTVQDRFGWTVTPGAVEMLDLSQALLQRLNATHMNIEAVAAAIATLSAVQNWTVGGSSSLVASHRRMATSTLDAISSLVTAIQVQGASLSEIAGGSVASALSAVARYNVMLGGNNSCIDSTQRSLDGLVTELYQLVGHELVPGEVPFLAQGSDLGLSLQLNNFDLGEAWRAVASDGTTALNFTPAGMRALKTKLGNIGSSISVQLTLWSKGRDLDCVTQVTSGNATTFKGPMARVVIASANGTTPLSVTQLGIPLNLTLGLAPSRTLWPPSDATSFSSSRLLNCSRGWRRTFEVTCKYAVEASAATAKILHVCNGSATVSIDGAELCPLRRTCASWNVTRQEWSRDGCQAIGGGDDSVASCRCSHLTDFTVWAYAPIAVAGKLLKSEKLPVYDPLSALVSNTIVVLYCSFLIFLVVQLLMPPSESAAYLSRIRKTDFFQQAMEHAKRQETLRRLQRAADNGSGPPLRKRVEKIGRDPEVLMQAVFGCKNYSLSRTVRDIIHERSQHIDRLVDLWGRGVWWKTEPKVAEKDFAASTIVTVRLSRMQRAILLLCKAVFILLVSTCINDANARAMAEGLREGYLSLGLFAILIGNAVARLIFILPLAQLVAAGVWVVYKEQRKQQSLRLRVMDRGLGFCPLEKLSIFPSAGTRVSILRVSIMQLELVVKSMLEPSSVRAPRPSGTRKVSAIAPDTDDRPINEGDLVRAMLREYKNKLREEEATAGLPTPLCPQPQDENLLPYIAALPDYRVAPPDPLETLDPQAKLAQAFDAWAPGELKPGSLQKLRAWYYRIAVTPDLPPGLNTPSVFENGRKRLPFVCPVLSVDMLLVAYLIIVPVIIMAITQGVRRSVAGGFLLSFFVTLGVDQGVMEPGSVFVFNFFEKKVAYAVADELRVMEPAFITFLEKQKEEAVVPLPPLRLAQLPKQETWQHMELSETSRAALQDDDNNGDDMRRSDGDEGTRGLMSPKRKGLDWMPVEEDPIISTDKAFRDLLSGHQAEVVEEDYEVVEYVLAEEGDDVPFKPIARKKPFAKSPDAVGAMAGNRRRSAEEQRSSTERRSDADAWVLGGQQPSNSKEKEPRHPQSQHRHGHTRHAQRAQRRASTEEPPAPSQEDDDGDNEDGEPPPARSPRERPPHTHSSPSSQSQSRAQRQARYTPPPTLDEESTSSMRAEGNSTKKRIVYNAAAERQQGHPSNKATARTRRKRRTQDDEATELHTRDTATDFDTVGGKPLDGSLKEEELI